MSANVLKKINIGNPLINLGLMKLYEEHERIETDEELASFYHKLLSAMEGLELATGMTYAMIAFSTGVDFNPSILINDHDHRNKS